MIGYRNCNSLGLWFEVFEEGSRYRKHHRTWCVRFDLTRYVRRDCRNSSVKNGRIQDRLNPSTAGVGYMGELPDLPFVKKARKLWNGVIYRCYKEDDTRFPRYGAKGVRVCESWHDFSRFMHALPKVPGFTRWVSGEKLDLDKDIRGDGTVYALESCMFVSRRANIREAHNRPIIVNGVRWPGSVQFAESIGVGVGSVWRWLRGHRRPHARYGIEEIRYEN